MLICYQLIILNFLSPKQNGGNQKSETSLNDNKFSKCFNIQHQTTQINWFIRLKPLSSSLLSK